MTAIEKSIDCTFWDLIRSRKLGLTEQHLQNENKLGVVGFGETDICEDVIKFKMTTCLNTPVAEHIFRDVLQALGFYVSRGNIVLKKYSQLCLTSNDNDEEQFEMIQLGKLIFENTKSSPV